MSHPLDRKYEAEQDELTAKEHQFEDMMPEIVDKISDLSDEIAEMVIDEFDIQDKDVKEWALDFVALKMMRIS